MNGWVVGYGVLGSVVYSSSRSFEAQFPRSSFPQTDERGCEDVRSTGAKTDSLGHS